MRCQIPECSSTVVAKGMCDKHYRRVKKYGDANETGRPSDWGKRNAHPLNNSWRWIRARTTNGCVPRWDDFWKFVKDVGDRPGDNHTLRRLDESKPWGPGNWFWKERLASSDDRNAYARKYRKKSPLAVKSSDLRKRYGIGIEDYYRILDSQSGGCAICGGPQIERYKFFSVDHCHESNKVRGLLCDSCNRGLGFFKDNQEVLRRAALYLESEPAT